MKNTAIIGLLVLAMVFGMTVSSADAKVVSPLKQFEQGMPINEIRCNDGKILLKSQQGKPACVSRDTSGKLLDRGYTVIIQNVIVENNIIQNNIVENNITKDTVSSGDHTTTEQNETSGILDVATATLHVASPVEFVDDGREYDIVLQRRPAGEPIYSEIMNSTTGLIVPGPAGASDIQTTPHVKYSVNNGVGLYIEDWMPTYIPDGYRLLYADTGYDKYDRHNMYSSKYRFVPNNFILHTNATSDTMRFQSDGFWIGVKINSVPFDEREDRDELFKDRREAQSGNYGGFIEMTRDGKYVSAYAGGNDLNRYMASIGFDPDEYTIVYVNSFYHTLDELIPVFESIMK